MIKVYDCPISTREVTRTIWTMCQGVCGLGYYAVMFDTLGAEGGRNEESFSVPFYVVQLTQLKCVYISIL